MENDVLEKYKKAGEIAAQVLKFGKDMVKPGLKIIDLAEAIDKKILELKGKPAFPVNVSINEIAAHWTPQLNDENVIQENDYVKIDVGIHIDGYIGDTALTVRPSGKDKLIECSEKMLAKALEIIRPGLTIGELGEEIENVCKEFGFNSVRNLTGHSLSKYDLHAGMMIPNIKNDSKYQLREDEVYAIEPFCTAGNGFVKDSEPILIFRWISDHAIRLPEGRKVLELAKIKYNRLPFAKRWLQKIIPSIKLELALKQLMNVESLYGYNPLKETSRKPVAQSEHTVIVKEKPIITTL